MCSLKWARTISIALLWFNYGIYANLPGTSLIDLTLQLRLSYHAVSNAIALRGLGLVIGGFLGGFVVDNFAPYRALSIGVSYVACPMLILVPWIYQPVGLCVLFVAIGTCNGIGQLVTQSIILETWGMMSKTVLPFMVLWSAVSGIVIPPISNPFLASMKDQTEVPEVLGNSTIQHRGLFNGSIPPSNEHLQTESSTYVRHLYYLMSGVCLLLGFPYIITEYFHRMRLKAYEAFENTEENTSDKSQVESSPENPSSCSLYGCFVLVVVFLFTLNNIGVYLLMAVFIRTFAIDRFGLTRDTGSKINSLYFVGTVTGSISCSIISYRAPVGRVLMFYNCLLLLSNIVLCTFALDSLSVFWVTTFLAGFPSLAGHGLFIPYVDQHVSVRGAILSSVVVARGLADLFFVALGGYLFDNVGSWTIPFMTLLMSIVCCAAAICFAAVNYIRNSIAN